MKTEMRQMQRCKRCGMRVYKEEIENGYCQGCWKEKQDCDADLRRKYGDEY